MDALIASPTTRRIARQNDIDLESLARELGRQEITRADVEAKASGAQPASRPAGQGARAYWDVDHRQYGPVEATATTRFDRIAAANLAAAQALIPAVTHHDRADVTEIEAFRRSLRPEAEARGVKLTALAYHVKALARALEDFPRFNASLSPDGETLFLKRYYDIGVAVDTPHGLLVPVIRGVDGKGLWRIAAELGDLAERARTRKVRPEEMGGAGMTITSLGGLGGRAFTPIVNPPEVAILGITRTETAPVWNGSTFEPREMTPLDLTYDHRVLNGADAARFMTHYRRLLSEPRRLLA